MTAAMKLILALWKKSYDKPRPHIKKQRHHIANKYPYHQRYGFSSNHVWMWDLAIKKAEHQRTDASKLWCWRRLLRIPWTARRLNPSILKETNQPWVFIGRIDPEAEAPILWPPDEKSQLIGKGLDAGEDWGQEKATPEDEMVGWHHWLNGHESEQTPEDSEGQGSLACCSPWGHKELDMTEWLNNKLYYLSTNVLN